MKVTMKHVLRIIENRENVTQFARGAVAQWGATIGQECVTFSAMRDADGAYWARLVAIKAILSPGARLNANIQAAHNVHASMMAGYQPRTFDDVAALFKGSGYGTAAYGNNVRALLASWNTIRALTPEAMTWKGLTALRETGNIFGFAEKVRSWALALFDCESPVVTLDRWMLRGLLALAGEDVGKVELAINSAPYEALAAFMLEIAEEIGAAPLIMQWSMWNQFRGGEHATHAALSDDHNIAA
jgi:hypothetical protein